MSEQQANLSRMPPERMALEDRIFDSLKQDQLQQAAELALQGYGPEILGYLVSAIGDETVATEVFSDFCEDLWVGLPGYQGRSSFRTWAYRLTKNAQSKYLRKRQRRRENPLQASEISRLMQPVLTSTLPYFRTGVKDGFTQLRDELPPEDRELLILRIDRSMSWEEIAQIFGDAEELVDEDKLKKKAATLRQRFKRLKEVLKKRAIEAGIWREPEG